MKLELKTVLSPPVQPPVDSSSTDECVKGAVISAINIYHPGYPDTYNPLLRFLALDDGGVYYDLVYYACCIIAGNVGLETTKPGHITQAKAYLATSSSSKATPITLPSDRILREKLYFFHVSTLNNGKYLALMVMFVTNVS
ncbi:hypothetical protein GL218_01326 [Daldinia childiae]|uniref:uncharacterized protein n=1 Tax=Daldinia childiae TaxID=326645 RepID=UPI0014475B9B|nr:uncharacterized protein GL218_01326 [Daldinia childiae]KAF3064414.1 hypothetical protein GL218_01326 [Daldinia childiae]